MEKYGLEAAAEMSDFEIAHIQAVKNLGEKNHSDEISPKESKDGFESPVEKSLTSINDVQFTPANLADRVFGVKGAKGCASFTAARL